MAKALYIPNGIKNLKSQFPLVNWSNMKDYYLQAIDEDGTVVATTCMNVVGKYCDDDIRLHFVNYLGAIDSITFTDVEKEGETKSSGFEVGTSYPLIKSIHGLNRSNISSNDTYTAKSVEFEESELVWVQELFDSPICWMEWKGTQGQPDDYTPIVITDKKLGKKKIDDRFQYEAIIEFKLSHERKILRT